MKLPLQKERIPVKQILLFGLMPSFLKIIIYKIRGFKIGSNVNIGYGSVIISKDVIIKDNVQIGFFSVIKAKKIEIGEYSSIASLCFIDTEYFKIGKDTRIREQVKVGGIKTPDSELIVGDRCLINHSTFLNTTMPIVIGNDSAIGGHSLLFTHSSWLSKLDGFPVKFGPIKIGNNVWLSWQTFITASVEIGDDVIVQPNAVVSKNIPDNSIFTSLQNRIIPNILYKPVTFESKMQMIKQIVKDFLDYMEYQGIKVNNENGIAFCLIDRINYRIIIQEDEKVEFSSNYCSILLTFKESNNLIGKISNKDMVLSFIEKTRRGSNLLGEELINFFSRYGIRFKRKVLKIYLFLNSIYCNSN